MGQGRGRSVHWYREGAGEGAGLIIGAEKDIFNVVAGQEQTYEVVIGKG